MQNNREAAANAGASARAGFEKAKATVQGQADKMRANDPNEKEMVRERTVERMNEAEYKKQQARDQNAQAKHTGGYGYTTGAPGGNTRCKNATPCNPICGRKYGRRLTQIEGELTHVEE